MFTPDQKQYFDGRKEHYYTRNYTLGHRSMDFPKQNNTAQKSTRKTFKTNNYGASDSSVFSVFSNSERSAQSSLFESATAFVSEEDEATLTPRYKSENHLEVLFRMHASIWPSVFPYCILNCVLAYALRLFKIQDNDFLRTTEPAHRFMAFFVSFLIVRRSTLCLERYMEARSLISDMTRACKELIHHAVCYTRYKNEDEEGMKWRASVAKRIISTLRVVVTILQYPTKGQNVWEVSELGKETRQAMMLAVGESNQRSPLILGLFLRSVVASHIHKLTVPLDVNQELSLHDFTVHFLDAYNDLMVLMTTPEPFPLVQMTRTFLFVWVFTIPFALVQNFDDAFPLILIVFFITYGFIGLDLVSIEIEDPFGNKPNDFNIEVYAKNTYRDILVCIRDIDGEKAARKVGKSLKDTLREEIMKNVQNHNQFTRVNEWGGRTDHCRIDEIAEEIQFLQSREDDSDISFGEGDEDEVSLAETVETKDSFLPEVSGIHRKLHQRKNSNASFDGFAHNTRVRLDSYGNVVRRAPDNRSPRKSPRKSLRNPLPRPEVYRHRSAGQRTNTSYRNDRQYAGCEPRLDMKTDAIQENTSREEDSNDDTN